MKHFSKHLAPVLLFFVFAFLFAGNFSTVLAASLSVSPSKIVPFQFVTFNVTGCDKNDTITIKYKKNGGLNVYLYVALWKKTDANGNYSANAKNFGEVGIYSVVVTCQGKDWTFPDVIQVEEYSGEIQLIAGEAVDGEAILVVSGCPPNSEVLLDWKKVDSAGHLINLGQNEDIADANGISEHLFKSGTFVVDAACGGKNSPNYSFTVAGDEVEENTIPSLPPPPEPPCEEYIEGRCAVVKTAIGDINTDGVGIIFSIFVLILSLSGGILVLLIMYAGYLLMTSRGVPEQIQKARELLISAVVGFLFILFSFVILTVITTEILRIPGFN